MAFYLIGLGLNEKSISLESLETIKKCRKIYLDFYTVDFPYDIKNIEKIIGKKIISLNRGRVEGEKFIDDAKKTDVALLVYGSPFFATTHFSLIETCKEKRIKFKILYNASVFDSIAETGLYLYNFGKIISLPKWDEDKNYKPTSFVGVLQENLKINAHTLILVDIGLDLRGAINQLLEASRDKIKLNKIIICSNLGTKDSKLYYIDTDSNNIKNMKIKPPFCFIIPGEKLNFKEKEALEKLVKLKNKHLV